MKKTTLTMVLLAGSMMAQQITDSRTATRRGGGGGEGKCTIEVEVDSIAEVEIFGNRAQIRTLDGGPSTIRRFECNMDMPNNPGNFRFQGIDGRGRQELVRQPGRGPAVVRIEDSKGGREGYTFDIFWNGSAGFGGGGGGFGNGGYNNGGYNNGGGYNRPNNGGIFGNNGNGNWNRDLNFRGRGDGYYRDDRGQNTRLQNCRMTIDSRGNVEVTFNTDSAFDLTMRGRVTRQDGDMIYADMNGNNMRGSMEISTDGRNRVRNVFMRSGGGRGGFELSWRE